ncbi:MAG: DUF2169 domain-containing protein [Polyangiaceae bacterium]
MIPTKKITPLAFGYRVTSRRPPQRELVLALRGKYRLHTDGRLELVRAKLDDFGSDESSARRDELEGEARARLEEACILVGQGSLRADIHADDDPDRTGEVLYPSDFAEFKPRADLLLRGTCHAPKGATTCHVGFGVGDFEKRLRVTGPRVWVDRIAGGKATDPLEIGSVPVDWRHAWGGLADRENPVGVGRESRELPAIEDPRRPEAPAGFAPLNPTWSVRSAKVGKEYGEAWEKTRAPWYPVDYDWSAQNAAPEDQQIEGYLRGDEELRFENLNPEAPRITSALPGIRPRAFVLLDESTGGGRLSEIALVLDTVFVDMEAMLVHVVWRGLTPVREDDLSDVSFLYLADEPLAEAPRPKEEYEAALRAFARDPYGLEENPATELAKLEEKLESGELERELAALPPGEDPFARLFGSFVQKSSGGDAMLRELRGAFEKTLGTNPDARAATTAYLVGAMRMAFDGPGAPRPVMTSDGKVEGKPLLLRQMREIAKHTREAKAPPTALEAATHALKESVANADTPGLEVDDVRIPDALDPPEPEPGADFSGFDLDDRDFSGRDLTGCKFDGALLRGVSFRGSTLARASFRGATLTRCDFTDADLSDADLTQAHLTRARLVGACLRGAELGQANLVRCDASGARFSGAKAGMMQIERTKLIGASCEDVAFEKCAITDSDAERARFSGARLEKSFFRQTALSKAKFDKADVTSGGFFGCNLTAASFFAARGRLVNFQGSKLAEADMRHAHLPESVFMNVPAEGADLFAANLRRARLSRAGLRGARLDKADLLQADIRKAVLTDASFRGANCYQAAFIEAHGNDAEFAGANLDGANFQRSNLTRKS